ncbi:zn-dependent hydrolase yycJ/walJ [hydrocarbon metagenome]|uniref:Zn-dependent hydrolase yycJ/walJ n=1 Tax=hydrocarbon metagenome TaxID=938273 RepID=A0A0W8E4L9_9ZZZZ
MEIHILASGSTGNAAVFKFGDTTILLDAGISARRIERGLAEVGVRTGDLDGVLLTHEHNDHIKGLDVLIRRHHIPVYTRSGTWQKLPCRHGFPAECCQEIEDEFSIRNVGIAAFDISHDAADAVGFSFCYQGKKVVMATDLGVVTAKVEKEMEYADAVVLEANHDLDMLENGPYPYFLKQRIKSSSGHLSNVNAGRLLSRINYREGMRVFLAHLSRHNNHPDLAESTVQKFLTASGHQVGKDIILHRTFPDCRTSVIL